MTDREQEAAGGFTPSIDEVREALAEWMWSRRMFRPETALSDGAELDRFLAAHCPTEPDEDNWEYEVSYSNAANPGVDGYRLRSAIKFATEPEAQDFAWRVPNPVIRRRVKERKAGDWEPVTPRGEQP